MIGIAHSSPSVSGLDRLVRRDESAEGLGVDAPIAVRDHLQREVVYARQPTLGSPEPGGDLLGCNPWAGAAGPCGSVPRSGRSCPAAIHPPARCAVATSRPRSAGCTSRGGPVRSRRDAATGWFCATGFAQLVQGRQRLPVLLHLVGAEELRAQRRLRVDTDVAVALAAARQCRGDPDECPGKDVAVHRRPTRTAEVSLVGRESGAAAKRPQASCR